LLWFFEDNSTKKRKGYNIFIQLIYVGLMLKMSKKDALTVRLETFTLAITGYD